MPNAKYLAHLPHQTQKWSFMRCAKSQKLYNMATVSLQICKNTDKCCKNFIVLYSLFLSSLFIFSFLFSLTLRFPLCSPYTGSLSLWLVRDVHWQRRRRSSDDDSALRHARSHPRSSYTRSHPCLAMLDLADLTPRPPSISPSSLSSLSAFHSASL